MSVCVCVFLEHIFASQSPMFIVCNHRCCRAVAIPGRAMSLCTPAAEVLGDGDIGRSFCFLTCSLVSSSVGERAVFVRRAFLF